MNRDRSGSAIDVRIALVSSGNADIAISRVRASCRHCRECQYISGGAPNMFMLVAPQGFRYASGEPRKFSRSDLENPVTREFCGECGTHLTTRRPVCH
jgi:hypothetical protein